MSIIKLELYIKLNCCRTLKCIKCNHANLLKGCELGMKWERSLYTILFTFPNFSSISSSINKAHSQPNLVRSAYFSTNTSSSHVYDSTRLLGMRYAVSPDIR